MGDRKLKGSSKAKPVIGNTREGTRLSAAEHSLPGGPIRSRPLHFIWIVDCSGSMVGDKGDKIQALNTAIRESIFSIREAQESNPEAQILIRSIKFSNGAQWHVPNPTTVDDFEWDDLAAGGETDMGKALKLVAEQLEVPPMQARAMTPVLVLISDGQPTDDFDGGLASLERSTWGKKALRLAIAIGKDADEDILRKFMRNNPDNTILRANNHEQLAQYVKWVSAVVVRSVGNQSSKQDGCVSPQVIPVPEPAVDIRGEIDDVW